jgi:alkanesulfonate monooxygenase
MSQLRAQAAAFGRAPGFNVSVRPIIAGSEAVAWTRPTKSSPRSRARKAGVGRRRHPVPWTMPGVG